MLDVLYFLATSITEYMVLLFFFMGRFSLYSPSWSWLAFYVLKLQDCTIMTDKYFFVLFS